MKKNKLIELLQSIKGNPEIVIWNGLAEDYHHIGKIESIYLYKQSKEKRLKDINNERFRDGLEPITVDGILNEDEYQFANKYFDDKDINHAYDKKKKVLIIEPKIRNKTSYGRMNLEY